MTPRILNPAMFSAYMKGYRNPDSPCPYRDHRTVHGSITWSRAFSSAFCEGKDDAKAGRPVRYVKRVVERRAKR